MDGRQEPVTAAPAASDEPGKKPRAKSLRVRLAVWMSAAIVAVAVGAGALSFMTAFDEAHELQDDELKQIAALVEDLDLPSDQRIAVRKSDDERRVIVQLLGGPGAADAAPDEKPGEQADEPKGNPDALGEEKPDGTPDLKRGGVHGHGHDKMRGLVLPPDLPSGFHTLKTRGAPWRVFVRALDNGERVAVAQRTSVRDEIARNSALRTLLPSAVLIPLLVAIVLVLIGRMLKPVARLAAELDARGEHDLSALPAGEMPREIVPFTAAIDRLLARVSKSIEQQKRFVADAAHELRSPLTALSLQVESLEGMNLPRHAQSRLEALKRGVARGRALVDQLLSLARSQSAPLRPLAGALGARNFRPVSVQEIFRRVIEDLMPLAEKKGIDLGVAAAESEDEEVTLAAAEMDLATIVRNLVDNAIRYSPPGGRVDLSVRLEGSGGGASAAIRVADTGPGIPVDERARIFDPFYRVLGSDEIGSGLGLSIVKTIVDRLGGSVTLEDAAREATQPGLRVTVRIPVGKA